MLRIEPRDRDVKHEAKGEAEKGPRSERIDLDSAANGLRLSTSDHIFRLLPPSFRMKGRRFLARQREEKLSDTEQGSTTARRRYHHRAKGGDEANSTQPQDQLTSSPSPRRRIAATSHPPTVQPPLFTIPEHKGGWRQRTSLKLRRRHDDAPTNDLSNANTQQQEQKQREAEEEVTTKLVDLTLDDEEKEMQEMETQEMETQEQQGSRFEDEAEAVQVRPQTRSRREEAF